MPGKSDFPIRINRLAISQIANMSPSNKDLMRLIADGAPKEDVDAAIVLLNLTEYLQARHVQPDFEVVLSE